MEQKVLAANDWFGLPEGGTKAESSRTVRIKFDVFRGKISFKIVKYGMLLVFSKALLRLSEKLCLIVLLSFSSILIYVERLVKDNRSLVYLSNLKRKPGCGKGCLHTIMVSEGGSQRWFRLFRRVAWMEAPSSDVLYEKSLRNWLCATS